MLHYEIHHVISSLHFTMRSAQELNCLNSNSRLLKFHAFNTHQEPAMTAKLPVKRNAAVFCRERNHETTDINNKLNINLSIPK